MNPYQYGANSPLNFIDINGDSIKYANAQIQGYVEQYSSPTITKKNGKIKKNKNYDPAFAAVIQELEASNMMFNFTDNGSGLGVNTLGQVSPQGDGHNIDVVVPDHSGTAKSSSQDLAGGRGAILAEETYHAAQVARGDLVEGNGGFKGTDALSITGAEIDAKMWASDRAMSNSRTTIQGSSAPSMMGLIKSTRGTLDQRRGQVYDILIKGTTRTITRATGGTMTITYPKTYDPK